MKMGRYETTERLNKDLEKEVIAHIKSMVSDSSMLWETGSMTIEQHFLRQLYAPNSAYNLGYTQALEGYYLTHGDVEMFLVSHTNMTHEVAQTKTYEELLRNYAYYIGKGYQAILKRYWL